MYRYFGIFLLVILWTVNINGYSIRQASNSSSINYPDPTDESCCEAHDDPVCSDEITYTCVCEDLPECCDVAWSELCVAAGRLMCTSQCSLPVQTPLNYIETVLTYPTPQRPDIMLYRKIREFPESAITDTNHWVGFVLLSVSEVSSDVGYIYTEDIGSSDRTWEIDITYGFDPETEELTSRRTWRTVLKNKAALTLDVLYSSEKYNKTYESVTIDESTPVVVITIEQWPFSSLDNSLLINMKVPSSNVDQDELQIDRYTTDIDETLNITEYEILGVGKNSSFYIGYFDSYMRDNTLTSNGKCSSYISAYGKNADNDQDKILISAEKLTSTVYLSFTFPSFNDKISFNTFFTIKDSESVSSDWEDSHDSEEGSSSDYTTIIVTTIVIPIGFLCLVGCITLIVVGIVLIHLKTDGGIPGALGTVKSKLPCIGDDDGIWWDEDMGATTEENAAL
eukprot:TRINITY_DN2504_c0_g1_i1.p1 TRINITY_DN2504_c0_g1~~TRINITY_DN2504_c0_g1_i1.p1  ORF type:complete len:452 (-),score=56.67 TRINITY_DN2504_c0_g1_i1:20-1375(-)